MSKTKDLILGNLHEHLNIPGLVQDMLDEVLEPALKKVVADTSNPFDDVLLGAIYPVLEKELNELVQKYWDELVSNDEPGDPL